MNKTLSDKELSKYVRRYTEIYPEESLPSVDISKGLRYACDIVFETKRNLLYMKKQQDTYVVFGHWCLANKKSPARTNMKAFFEILRLWKALGKKVVFEELNAAYVDIVDSHNRKV